MKALLVIYTICIIDTLCQGVKVSEKVYPKKFASGKIIINTSKYEKTSKGSKGLKPSVPSVAKSYTAFQFVNNNQQLIKTGIPDSPYFPIDPGYHQKSSVKKVLPEHPWSLLRRKRSADVLIVPPAEKDEKNIEPKAAEVQQETTQVPVAAVTSNKAETTVTPSSSPKEFKEESKSAAKIIDTTEKQAQRSRLTTPSKNKKKPASAPARKGQPKSKAAAKKNNGRLNRKPKGKNAAARAKPKGKQVKKNLKRHGPLQKNKRKPKGNLQRSKNQKAKKQKNAHAGKALKETRTRRLTGASEALIEDYPYVVSIQKDEQHWCSGALLSPRMVITTANCLWKANRISRMEVRVGSRHVNRGGQVAGIQEVAKHPNWSLRKGPDNDVALVLLNKNIRYEILGALKPSGGFTRQPVVDLLGSRLSRLEARAADFRSGRYQGRFSDSVHGVDLPNREMMPPFEDAWITSWGAERRDGVYDNYDSTTLQVYHARLIEREKCNNITMRFSAIVTDNFICLAQSGRQAPCTRDTGAPAVSDGVLWGLASWGIRKLCGTERYPAMFSYLASHSNMDFIMNTTRNFMSEKREYPFPDRYTENKKK